MLLGASVGRVTEVGPLAEATCDGIAAE
jgi:hypothetical protein